MKINSIFFKLSYLLVVLLLFSCSEDPVDETGKGTIIGKVVRDGSFAPMVNVKIETTPVSNTVFTNEKGEFIIEDVVGGEYSVKAQLDGFVAAFKSALVQHGKKSNVVFELSPSSANNKPPTKLELLYPVNNEILTVTSIEFKWTAEDPNDDNMTYILQLRNDFDSRVEVFKSIVDTTFSYSNLKLGAKYFWQITANDGVNEPVVSSMNSFRVYKAPLDNRILFTRSIGDNLVIYSTTENGEEFQLTDSNVTSFRPRINMAANKIAYLQSKEGIADIFIMEKDGTSKQKVTSFVKPNGFDLREINFSWPANSDKIYYPNFDKLYRINTNGQGLVQIYETTDGSLISEVDVDEVNQVIVLKTNNINGYGVRIYTIDFSGNEIENILMNSKGAAGGLQFSYDGKRILYAYDMSSFENAGYVRKKSRMFVYDLITKSRRDVSGVTPNGTNDLDPRFSPNEAFIIFTNSSNDGLSQKNVYFIELPENEDDGQRTLLKSNAFMPEWN